MALKLAFPSREMYSQRIFSLHNRSNVGSYELAYSGNGATCNGATAGVATATSAPPQPSGAPEKTKEKVGSSERAPGKGYGAHNGEKLHLDSHAHNGEKSCQGHGTKPHNGDSCERYRWSRCKRPLPLSSMRISGIPSPPDNVEVSLFPALVTLL